MEERIVEVDFGEKDLKSNDKIKEIPKNKNNDELTEAGDQENEIVEIKKKFDYLMFSEEEPIPFFFDISEEKDNLENIYENLNENEYKYAICILLKDNSFDNCALLEKTIKGIIYNYGDLATIKIEPKDIYMFVFVNKIIDEQYLVTKESIKLITREKNYLKLSMKPKDENREIKIDLICKKNYMSDIESLQCFYNYILPKFKKENKIIISSIITAGVVPSPNCLKKLIQMSFPPNEKNPKQFEIVVPALEISEDKNFFIKIGQYDRIHFNIYNMNFYSSTAGVPISSLLNTMILDDSLLNKLNSYYRNISINATIDYHDYNLALTLFKEHFEIKYYGNETLGTISYVNFNYLEYKDLWINKFSGYYGNFFEILRSFAAGNKLSQKIFMVFQIIGLLIEFIYPSLSILVIYSIFYEAFGLFDINLAVFMTLLYLIMYLGSGVCSMISDKSKNSEYANYFFYIFMEVYYLFILLCSIPAMDNIKKEKYPFNSDNILVLANFSQFVDYKFNTAACACLIIFTFIISILPIIFSFSIFSKNISQMFFYFILGAPSSTSNFLIAKIWKAPETPGGSFPEERKGITIILFFLSNLFFGFLCFYNYNRKLRSNCVMGLSIFYLIYLFFKMIAILSSLCNNRLSQISDNQIKNVLSGEVSNSIYENNNSLMKSTDKLKEKNNDENVEEKLDEDHEINHEEENNDNNIENKSGKEDEDEDNVNQ